MSVTSATEALSSLLPTWGRFAGARHVYERNLLVYRRAWLIVFSGFFEPLFYLFAVGVGVGTLVGDVQGPGGQTITYAQFVTPGLLAASAMNGAVLESTMNVFFKLKFGRIYDAVLSTPVEPGDIAVGEISWALTRGGLYAVGFLVVAGIGGFIPSWWGLLALPAAILIGLAFAGVGMAATTYMKSWQDFDLVTLFVLPMFLFSAVFYPLDILPPAFQLLTQLSPLYHGVELMRGFMFGMFDLSMIGHAAVLVAMWLTGIAIAARRIRSLLLT
ncbi:MAG: ABC transporter permease [Nitriliruptorales bacterium]